MRKLDWVVFFVFFLIEWKLLSILALVKIFLFDIKSHASFLKVNNTNAQVFESNNHRKRGSKKAAFNKFLVLFVWLQYVLVGQCKSVMFGYVW